jgi:2-C-methyl-D-erythritol 4-phosphate cytidylyltransferase/2-C-methyl-D-erythritol 2,4-cyclodiphosphate synthase
MNNQGALPTYWAIVPAAGGGARFDSALPKQYCLIQGKTLLEHIVEKLLSCDLFKHVVVVLSKEDKRFAELPISQDPRLIPVIGADTRMGSVGNGLNWIKTVAKPDDWVLVHDAARAALNINDLMELMHAVKDDPIGGILGVPVKDTMKRVNDGKIEETVARAGLWHALTPQMFRLSVLLESYDTFMKSQLIATDESEMVEACGVFGVFNMRIGHGYDIHRFDTGENKKAVTLGGVMIPCPKGLIAHSDGDVVIHAICDAILGALGLGDIGEYFPDTDQQFENCDSRYFLTQIMEKVKSQGYGVGNVDVTILAEIPKITPHKLLMKERLAADLEISINDINIKATTHEKLDAVGQSEGIAVHAVVLLNKSA